MSIYSSKGDGPEALIDAGQSEKRLRLILDGMTDAYYVLDREWRFIEIDGRAPVYFGCPREELADRCIWELYPQYEGGKTWEEYHRAVSENVPVHFETRSASGGYFFEVHAYPQPDGLAVYLRDLTERKRAEEALRESERKYERLIKYAPAAIYEIDFQKNRFISVNDAMCLMSGYSREELLAMDPFDIMNEQSRVTFKKRLEQWLKDDKPLSQVDYLARGKDGREAWVALNVSFTRDENGAPLGAMSVAQDISDRKRAEERIKLQNTILQAINKAYEQYVLCSTLEELRKACLEIIEEITGSAISFIGEIGEDGLFHDTAIRSTGWEQCEMFDSRGQKRKTGDFPIRGLYGSVLRNAKTLMTNDPESHTDSHGVPEGHIALTAFLGVPFIQCGHVTGMAAVANRNGGYTENEKEILEAVTPTVCEVLLRKRAEEELLEKTKQLVEANRQKADILESISDCFYALDKELRFVYVNKHAEEIWGIPRADLIGRSIEEVFKGLIDVSLSKFRIAMKEQTPQHYEVYSKVIDRWGEISVYPTRDGICVYFRDTTESKRAEEALQISEANFRAVFECSPMGILAGDMEGRVVQSNPAIEHMLGYSKEELRGMAFSEFTYAEDSNLVTPLVNELIEGKGDYYEIEKRYIRKGGQVFWIKLIVTLMQGGSGEKLGLALIEDITERKKAEEALRENEERTRSLLEELAEADRNKNEFLSALSHELRNPLGAISAGLQLMDITNDEKQARTAKEIMNRQMDQLCHLVDDLLDLTRITNNKITLKKESVDINKLIRLYVRDFRPLFDKKQIKLKLIHSGGKLFVNADPVRIKQITGNLLHNASKFTNKGGEVKLSAYEEGGYAVICVKDSGIGIKPSDLPKLFEPFAQIDSHIDRANGGLGLGLSIVREIARLHGGDAEAESAGEGQGASFYIKLPLESAGNESKPDGVPPAENAGKLKVLFIEDNKDYSEMLCSMLRILGHEAAAAFDGAGGLKAAEEYMPDVIICDIGLPGMNGYEVARAVTSGGMVKRPYMAALSGYARPQDIEAAKQAGFDRHIAKPVTLETLKQILAAVRQ